MGRLNRPSAAAAEHGPAADPLGAPRPEYHRDLPGQAHHEPVRLCSFSEHRWWQ